MEGADLPPKHMRITLMFSATFADQVQKIAAKVRATSQAVQVESSCARCTVVRLCRLCRLYGCAGCTVVQVVQVVRLYGCPLVGEFAAWLEY